VGGQLFAVPPDLPQHLSRLGQDLHRAHQQQPRTAVDLAPRVHRSRELLLVYIEQCIVSDISTMSGNPFRTSPAPNRPAAAPPPTSFINTTDARGGAGARVERDSDAGICSPSY